MLKKQIEEIVGCYKEQMFISHKIKDDFPLFKLNPIQLQESTNPVNNVRTDAQVIEATIFDKFPTGCLDFSELYDIACDEVEKYKDLLRAVIWQLEKRYKYGRLGSITVNIYPYEVTSRKLFAVRIRATVTSPTPPNCCSDFLFDVSKLPKKSWADGLGK